MDPPRALDAICRWDRIRGRPVGINIPQSQGDLLRILLETNADFHRVRQHDEQDDFFRGTRHDTADQLAVPGA